MASKDYDDLLESFMNNSAKVYKEDKDSLEKGKENVPASYQFDTHRDKKSRKSVRGRKIAEKQQKKSKGWGNSENHSAASKVFRGAGKGLLALIMVFGVVCIVCISVVAVYGYSVVFGDPVFDLTEEKYSQNQTSIIYGTDFDGQTVEITRLHGEENRIWVNMDDMSEYMAKAFIAIEDKRFYDHSGVDWIRTIGVVVKPDNLGQGGSTITQQLIKNLTDENQVTFVRKFNEILQALNIDKNYEKDEIIEAYLNTVYLSSGCYGVKTAAETYFGKEVSDLNIAECASIAAITQWPNKYDPLVKPENNRTRQLTVLENMLDQGLITQDQYDEAVAYEMVFTNSENYTGSQLDDTESDTAEETEINSYYVDYVINSVIEDLQKMGYSAKKARSMIYGGGLNIYTAIDFEIQDILEDVYENYRRMPDETVQGAMCIMDYSGRVLGIVGGTGEKTGNLVLNRATQSTRQPGSTIKPLSVYGPALEKSLLEDDVNIYWSTILQDKPLKKIDGKWWPTNQGGSYSSNNVTLQYGLAQSLNTISARTLDLIGVDYSFDYISDKFHISTLDSVNDPAYAPLATGSLTNGITVLEMTAAYASFGNGGYYYEPYCYYKITDSQGDTVIEKDPEKTKESALSENTAWIMNKLLQTVMTGGTGRYYKLSGIECFGKTGTTTDDKDRWFVGGTPNYVAAVWYGYDTPKEIVYNLSYNPCGTIWNLVMNEIYETLDEDEYDTEFPEAKGIVQRSYCPSCGKLRSGTGVYGWYDSDNLPGYCNGGHGYSGGGGSSSNSDTASTSANTGETTLDSETTQGSTADTGETSDLQTTQAQETTQQSTEQKPSEADNSDDDSDSEE